MKAEITISDAEFKRIIENRLIQVFDTMKIETLVESKVNNKIDAFISSRLSEERIFNFTKDRISRIITTQSLESYSYGIDDKDVLANVDEKILLMIQHSPAFKALVRSVLKDSL